MKRLITAAAIGLFFLVILGLVLFKLFSSGTSSNTPTPTAADPFKNLNIQTQVVYNESPYRLVISCYTWYLKVRLTPATTQQLADLPQSSSCFTKSFISQWDSILSKTEGDPVLTVADYGPTWTSSIQAATVGQSIRSNDQQVTLGTGDGALTLIVHTMRQQDDTWRIDSVSTP